mmetsp:Transcript_40295/g.121364  ORF Transcript_40295/g.121364 Transcript_40295/m.121364 type:complete len:252 (+) Transcript_40295:766-1521(+)
MSFDSDAQPFFSRGLDANINSNFERHSLLPSGFSMRHDDNASTPCGPILHSDKSRYSSFGNGWDSILASSPRTNCSPASQNKARPWLPIPSFLEKFKWRNAWLFPKHAPIISIPVGEIFLNPSSIVCNFPPLLFFSDEQSAATPSSPMSRFPIARLRIPPLPSPPSEAAAIAAPKADRAAGGTACPEALMERRFVFRPLEMDDARRFTSSPPNTFIGSMTRSTSRGSFSSTLFRRASHDLADPPAPQADIS